MSMSSKDRGRYWGIRVLVAVLALTASRANFPISQWLHSIPMPRAGNQAALAATTKQTEGITPSRRHVESRKAAWLRKSDGEPFPQTSIVDRGADLACNSQAILQCFVSVTQTNPVTSPDYLQLFLGNSQVSSLPPPV